MKFSPGTIASWHACERQTREVFCEWASYRIKVLQDTSSTEWTDGRLARYLQLLGAAGSPEDMARAWSSGLDPETSITKAQYLAGVLRTGEPLIDFLGRVNGFMRGEIGLLPLIREAFEVSHRSAELRRELLFRRYERRLPSYNIPINLDLMAESALYGLYVAWSPSSKVGLPDNRKELWRAIAIDDEALRIVTPRKFEELVAFIYERLGYRAEVTGATRDNGADVLAWQPGPFGTESLIVVQTKLYSGENKVTLAGVHALHGAVAHYNAKSGHLVATTDLTGPAKQFLNARGYDFVDLSALRREVEAFLGD